MIFDGKCAFCRVWVEYWRTLTGTAVEYAPSQEVGSQYPQIDPERFKHSVQVVLPNGEAHEGAEAVFLSLSRVSGLEWPLWLYRHVPGVRAVTEFGYRIVADHRDLFYWLTKHLFGIPVPPMRYEAVVWWFLRALAVIYACAFGSLLVQLPGLLGSHGVLPAGEFLKGLSSAYHARAVLSAPSLFWINSSDEALLDGCWFGLLASVLLFLNRWPRAMLVLLFVLYLSYVSIGQVFLAYQWDLLLTEAGFLAIFLGSSRAVVWLFRWLLFRLYFLSAAVKLLSGDVTWRTWQALRYHYETQPLPTPIAWYLHQLPPVWQAASTIFVLAVEGIIPFFVFAPRRLRHAAAIPYILLQVLILLSGNYGFFNWLTIALCLFFFDDGALPRWMRKRQIPARVTLRGRYIVAGPAALVLLISSLEVWQTFGRSLPAPALEVMAITSPLGIANPYGLFAVMTTERPELLVEGSMDGEHWQAYEFPNKPGDVHRAPPWVAPHLPRLDWQMWFAALGEPQRETWMWQFLLRLLEGSPDVQQLLRYDPFAQAPPKFVRVQRYQYHFTNFAERRATKAWWKREPAGLAIPPIGLREGDKQAQQN